MQTVLKIEPKESEEKVLHILTPDRYLDDFKLFSIRFFQEVYVGNDVTNKVQSKR